MDVLERAAQAVSIILFVTLTDGKVFMPMVISRNHKNPKWKPPTGNVEVTKGVSEDIFSAAVREICEETGLVVDLAEIKSPRAISQIIQKGPDHQLYILACTIERNQKDINHQLRYEDVYDGRDLLHVNLFSVEQVLKCVEEGETGLLPTRDGLHRYGMLPSHIGYFKKFWESLDMPTR